MDSLIEKNNTGYKLRTSQTTEKLRCPDFDFEAQKTESGVKITVLKGSYSKAK